MKQNFSVLMSVYIKENPAYLKMSLDSIFNQSIIPNEVILVKDGGLTKELDDLIADFSDKHQQLRVIALEKNVGLGEALNIGLKHCSFELVARMDSDDYCNHLRFEKQLSFFIDNPSTVLVGSNIGEFFDNPLELKSVKKMPVSSEEIKYFSKRRNPFNHPAVMFKKSKIESVGGYKDMMYFEDYYLWLRIINQGYETHNIDDNLVMMRANSGMFKRRGGVKYFNHSLRFRLKILKLNYISLSDFGYLLFIQFFNAIIPNKLRIMLYKKYLRS